MPVLTNPTHNTTDHLGEFYRRLMYVLLNDEILEAEIDYDPERSKFSWRAEVTRIDAPLAHVPSKIPNVVLYRSGSPAERIREARGTRPRRVAASVLMGIVADENLRGTDQIHDLLDLIGG